MSEHSHGFEVPVQVRSERFKSEDPAAFGEISNRDEQWRYLPSERLGSLIGQLSAFSGDIAGLPEATVSVAGVGKPEDLVTARVWEVAKPKHVSLQSDASEVITVTNSGEAQALRLNITNAPHTKSLLVLNHIGSGELAESVAIDVAPESTLTVVSIQNMDSASVFFASNFIRVGKNAHLKHIVVSLGGKTVRLVPSVEYAGPGGTAELRGAYFANGDQHLEHRPFIDHNQPNCVSDVAYKGALQGAKAHTVWVGDVLIRKEAEGTKTYELNRNLLLTDGARADSVPNLEIETGQIEGAGHASASGRFDDEQLFYLQARGISELEAMRLVVKGFLNDVISQIGVQSLENELNAIIESKLEGVN